VAAEFDFNLLPLYRIKGQEMPLFPGLLAVTAPKRPARGRESDSLLLYLSLSGNTRVSSTEYNSFINQTIQSFYQTSGSLTSAIRNAAGELNQFLLNRNLHSTGKGEYIVGRLILGVLRDTQFVFAQCGTTHVFHVTRNGTRKFHDNQIAGRGLGTSQTTPLYFAQVDLHSADLLVLCSSLPPEWDPTLIEEKNTSFETLRRKLLSISSDDLNAVLVHAVAGKGKLNILKGMQTSGQAPIIENPVHAKPSLQVGSGRPASRFARILSGKDKSTSSTKLTPPEITPQNAGQSTLQAGQQSQIATGQPSQGSLTIPAEPDSHPVKRMGRFTSSRQTTDIPEIKRPVSHPRRAFFGGLAKALQGARGGKENISRSARKFLPKLLPNSSDGSEVSGPSMALISIVIPVMIVAIAATVYIHYGRAAQYQQYYDLALAQASQARDQKNPIDVRRAWESTIYYLDLAEKKEATQNSNTLRQEAQTALDNLDGILRLDFRPAIIGGLSQTLRISHMAATDIDLFLLDASRGGVLRATKTNQSFQIDTTFKCDPGQYGTIIVEPLVDLEILPMSNAYNARLLAIDGKGNLLYCGLADPVAVSLVPPQLGWRSITAISLDSDGKNLYVLDSTGNAVWQYSGISGQFQDLPSIFFGEQVPQNMGTAIDLAANNSDLYLLFQDGHTTSCPMTHYAGVPMRCADPASFVDNRPERQPGPKINDAVFSQMAFASAPDPSLYLLEPLTRAIYRFSPRSDSLELRGQFRASMKENNTLFDGSATAMTISPNRSAFLCIDRQIFFATDVP
jgi:hypothetical protein